MYCFFPSNMKIYQPCKNFLSSVFEEKKYCLFYEITFSTNEATSYSELLSLSGDFL